MNNDLIRRGELMENAELIIKVARAMAGNDKVCNKAVDLVQQTIVELSKATPAVDAVEVVRKPVFGYEGYYEVDRFGRVFGLDRIITVKDGERTYEKPIAGKQMKQTMHDKGYKVVSLTKDGKTKMQFVHRLVAEAFIPNPENLPMVNHKDEDKTNNFAENLEWCTPAYNCNYGSGIKRHAKKLRGVAHTEEHNKKISEGMKRYRAEERERNGYCDNGRRREENA